MRHGATEGGALQIRISQQKAMYEKSRTYMLREDERGAKYAGRTNRRKREAAAPKIPRARMAKLRASLATFPPRRVLRLCVFLRVRLLWCLGVFCLCAFSRWCVCWCLGVFAPGCFF